MNINMDTSNWLWSLLVSKYGHAAGGVTVIDPLNQKIKTNVGVHILMDALISAHYEFHSSYLTWSTMKLGSPPPGRTGITETGLELLFIDLLLFMGSAGLSPTWGDIRSDSVYQTTYQHTCNLSLDTDLAFMDCLFSFLSGQSLPKLLFDVFSTPRI